MFTNLILAAQEGGHEAEPTGLDLVLPEPAELVGGLLAFVLVAFVLMKYAFPAIQRVMKERENTIQSDLEEAEKAKVEAQTMLDDYRRQLGEAKAEANRIIEEARGSAENVRRELIAKSEKEADAIVERAREQIAAERSRTLQELHSQIAAISIELAEKVIGRSVDQQAQRELIDTYIRDVTAMGNGGRGS